MKTLIFAILFSVFLYGCGDNPVNNGNNPPPVSNDSLIAVYAWNGTGWVESDTVSIPGSVKIDSTTSKLKIKFKVDSTYNLRILLFDSFSYFSATLLDSANISITANTEYTIIVNPQHFFIGIKAIQVWFGGYFIEPPFMFLYNLRIYKTN